MSSYSTSTGGASRRPTINPSSSWAAVVSGASGSTQPHQPPLPTPLSRARIHPSNSQINLDMSNTSSRYPTATISTSFAPGANGQAVQLNVLPTSLPTYLEESCYAERLFSVKNTPQVITQPNTLGKLPVTSYRGVALEVKENVAGFGNTSKDENSLPPLPTKWNVNDKSTGIEISEDGMDAKFVGPAKASENDAVAVRADHHMPRQCGVYYYEVQIINKGREGLIGIGFCKKDVQLSRLPGWEPDSWGYHGDDGKTFCCQSAGKTYGPQFATLDFIGCGVNFRTNTAFFTRNGLELPIAFKELNKGDLYPTVGMKRLGEHIRVNFGQEPFMFDIEGYVRAEKQQAYEDIHKASVKDLCPPLDESALIQSLIASYLQHDGFVETARAFAHDLKSEAKALETKTKNAASLDWMEDADAVNRQTIRSAILRGDIDHALRLTNQYYPDVLENNEKTHFRLRCRKFIEMMRQCAEEIAPMSRSSTKRKAQHDNYQDADEDVDMDIIPTHNGNSARNGKTVEWEIEMEDDSPDEDSAYPTGKPTLDEALDYGKELQNDFKDKPEMRKSLDEAFSLFAYVDPRNSVVAHLMDEEGRLPVAEELNSAILVSLGKSSISPLEKLVQQTTVLVREVGEGGGAAALVNINDWVASPEIAN